MKLLVEYDGTCYHGFQLQAGGVATIQAEIEQALRRIIGTPTRIVGAGRTDSGVHATGQVVSFRTDSALPASSLQRALNALLPDDIAVLATEDAVVDFHARFSARSREYRYTVLNRSVRSPMERRFACHIGKRLDVEKMSEAARPLVGEHDFASFSGVVPEGTSTKRRVQSVNCIREDNHVFVDVVADAFLPHMVRNIVGTLLLVGQGKLNSASFEEILAARNRHSAGATAPARGLCLTKVNYREHYR